MKWKSVITTLLLVSPAVSAGLWDDDPTPFRISYYVCIPESELPHAGCVDSNCTRIAAAFISSYAECELAGAEFMAGDPGRRSFACQINREVVVSGSPPDCPIRPYQPAQPQGMVEIE